MTEAGKDTVAGKGGGLLAAEDVYFLGGVQLCCFNTKGNIRRQHSAASGDHVWSKPRPHFLGDLGARFTLESTSCSHFCVCKVTNYSAGKFESARPNKTHSANMWRVSIKSKEHYMLSHWICCYCWCQSLFKDFSFFFKLKVDWRSYCDWRMKFENTPESPLKAICNFSQTQFPLLLDCRLFCLARVSVFDHVIALHNKRNAKFTRMLHVPSVQIRWINV